MPLTDEIVPPTVPVSAKANADVVTPETASENMTVNCSVPPTFVAGPTVLTEMTVGATVRSVKVMLAEPLLPAASVSLATTVFEPFESWGEGVNVQVPALFAVAVPSVTMPLVSVTTPLGSPPPVNASSDVILSVDDDPESRTSVSVTGGGVVSTVTANPDDSGESPLPDIAVAVSV